MFHYWEEDSADLKMIIDKEKFQSNRNGVVLSRCLIGISITTYS